MTDRDRGRITLAFLIPVAAGVFLLGVSWGLPSRAVDPFLFGEKKVWTGDEIARLAGARADNRLGADVDVNPVEPGGVFNDTDQKRAEIVRRYRLYTSQPDEMITMMALASMKPGQRDFDPKLYQYGGLWIYPVGALIRIFAHPKPSQEYYLDHPEEFGKFYVIARMYTVLWALIGVWAVYRIAHNAGAGALGSAAATCLYIFLPVVVNLAHESKPHLPGAVLILLATLAASRFIQTGKARWWIIAGALCGASAGMILSGVLGFVVLPTMVIFAGGLSWARRAMILACAIAIAVTAYFASNPYVLVHLMGDSTVLRSNLGNSRAMYEPGQLGRGFVNAMRLVAEGATPLVAIVGVIGAFVILKRTAKPQAASARILLIVAIVVMFQFIVLAAGKPGEYARFALLPDIALALSAAIFIGSTKIRTFEKIQSFALLIILAIFPSVIYLAGFVRDAGPVPRRLEHARTLAELHSLGASTLAIRDDPAPYLLPPVDLFTWKILKLPRDFGLSSGAEPADVILRPVDRLTSAGRTLGAYQQISEPSFEDVFPAQISWAAKPVEIWVSREFLRQHAPWLLVNEAHVPEIR